MTTISPHDMRLRNGAWLPAQHKPRRDWHTTFSLYGPLIPIGVAVLMLAWTVRAMFQNGGW